MPYNVGYSNAQLKINEVFWIIWFFWFICQEQTLMSVRALIGSFYLPLTGTAVPAVSSGKLKLKKE